MKPVSVYVEQPDKFSETSIAAGTYCSFYGCEAREILAAAEEFIKS